MVVALNSEINLDNPLRGGIQDTLDILKNRLRSRNDYDTEVDNLITLRNLVYRRSYSI